MVSSLEKEKNLIISMSYFLRKTKTLKQYNISKPLGNGILKSFFPSLSIDHVSPAVIGINTAMELYCLLTILDSNKSTNKNECSKNNNKLSCKQSIN